MINPRVHREVETLAAGLDHFWTLSGRKVAALAQRYDLSSGAPVHTVKGRYRPRDWTEWTLGFYVGSGILQFDATDDEFFLSQARQQVRPLMESCVSNFSVHDHGFTCVSTFGALLRLVQEGRVVASEWEAAYYTLALKVSGAVQARRWTRLSETEGFIYSFNGPHSLFADTIRSLRSLALAHRLGAVLQEEQDRHVSLLERLVQHARATAQWIVYYGEGRDGYDVRGRVAHEALFNVRSGTFRCPSTKQGYAPVTTWTRGLAWIICGFAELAEFVMTLGDEEAAPYGGQQALHAEMMRPLKASSDLYLREMSPCGIPYWDTGAPGLSQMGGYQERPADPLNTLEPVDSSAAAIAAQGLLRLGHMECRNGAGARYWQAGLKVASTLFSDRYLSRSPDHEGLLLHSIYHWPRRWDHVPEGNAVACGESVMWGDYHLRELALYLQRVAAGTYLTFWQDAPA